MSVQFDEHQMWENTGGTPVVNGYIYIGDQNADPVANPKSIFSDRALTAALANPVRTDSYGRAVSKIWLSGRYSVKVEDVNNVQIYQNLDNGEAEGIGISGLTNVAGSNTITAEASPTITAYVDGAYYSFEILLANTTDAVTLNIDSVGAKAIKRSFNQDVGIGRFMVGQKAVVIYNAGNDNFELVNDNRSVVLGVQGANIASAATVNLAAATGNALTITGTTNISSFGTVLAGSIFVLTFDGALTITAADYTHTTKAGEIRTVLSLGAGNWKFVDPRPEATGFVKPYVGVAAPEGYVLMDGGTIGNAGSGATTRANADTENLYALFWDSMADAQAPVSTGRGASAAADFAAGKTITISDLMNGSTVVGTGGTAPATHGDNGGEETHVLTEAELASHTHTERTSNGAGVTAAPSVTSTNAFQDTIETGSVGSDSAHNNMPPWVALSWVCKL